MEQMRRAGLAVLAWGALLTAAPCGAQETQASVRDDIELTRANVQTRRKEIVQQLMELTPQESEAFWPVYREYQNDFAKLGDDRVKFIENYLKNSATLSDEQAKKLLDDWFKFRQRQLDLQKKYVGRFQKVLPVQKVARLYQIENALDTVVSANLQANLPMVGDTTTP